MYRNVKGEVRDRRRAVRDREFLSIRKFHEDPNLAETDEPTYFDLIRTRNKADKDLVVKMDRDYEASVIRDEIEHLFNEKRKVGMRIAQLFQEEHLLSCDDDWCIECTKPIVDWYYDIFCN